MIFLANRANLDERTLLSRLHKRLDTRAAAERSPIEQVRYHTASGNKVGVRATVDPPGFVGEPYAVEEAELQVAFELPPDREYDHYEIQWVERARELMVGWHQDPTHPSLGECHFQVDYRGETVQRNEAAFLDVHPLNVFDRRTDELVAVLDSMEWGDDRPFVPKSSVR
jgi:hypothetical protein